MEKITKKIVSIILVLTLMLSSSIQVMAATIQLDNQTHDYSEINSLPYEYSYGTLFWTDDTEVIYLDTHPKYTKQESARVFRFGGEVGDTLSFKITNCSIDKEGNLCDVVVKITDIKAFENFIPNNQFGGNFGESITDEAKLRIEIDVSYNPTSFGNLIYFWFNANGASAIFNMTYYRSGTMDIADIPYTVSTLYDFDVPSRSSDKTEIEYFGGNEGMAMPNGTIYYDKGSDGWLIDANNVPTGYNVAVSTPSYTTPPITSNNPEKQTSCVAMQELRESTFSLLYSGRSCGIAWVFISPYTYEMDSPTITVDKERVYEEERFNYTISQYVPNNYYADVLQFIDNLGGKYNSFVIQDNLDANLVVDGDITVSNESGIDVTSYFDISVNNNLLKATLKTAYLSDSSFYSHMYNINVPAYIKSGTGKSTGSVSNSATTIVSDNLKTENLSTDEVDVLLKYDVDINSQIDNGVTYINEGKEDSTAVYSEVVNHNSSTSNTVYFTVADGYKLSKVFIEGKEIPSDNLDEKDGIYSYSFNDNNIITNIEHNVVINTVLKDASVVVNYLDESNKPIAESETLTGKVFDEYKTVAKDIYGYELTTTPSNATGTMTEDEITVNYIYRLKDTSVVVKHIDAETNEPLCDAETIKGKVFDKYTTSAKSFYGYRLVSEPKNASGTMTEETIEVVYSYTLKESSVVVNYIDENNNTIAPSESHSGKVGDSYTTEQKEIYGYNFVRVEGESKGNMIDGTITVNYIYTLKPASVVVNYVDSNGEEVATTETINGKFFDSYDTSSKEIKGYTLTEQPANASGTMNVEKTTVTYIYELDPACVIVNHLDENGKAIAESESIKGNYFDEYETSLKDIYGYELTATPDNASGTMTEDEITVNYIYRLKDTSVVVKHIDAETDEPLCDAETIKGKVFDEYTTAAKNFYGYSLVSEPINATGTMTEDSIEVVYLYKLKDASVIVNYIDENNNTIAPSETKSGKVGDSYTTEQKDIYGYNFVRVDGETKGNMIDGTITINYIYTLKPAKVAVNYLDESNKPIAEGETLTGKVFDEYETIAKEIYGYELTATPANASGTMTEAEITVNYIYRLKDTSVVVKHIDAETDEPLCDAETIKGKVFDEYTTSAKSFYGYKLVSEPINASGTMTEESIEVTYYYTLKDASIIVNYIDENNNTIAPSETKTGKVGDSYTTEQKEIYGYNFVRVEGEPKGNMIDGTITVNYIYTLKPASVVVNYVDTNGEEVATTETINGKFFDSYDTSSKEIKGYTLTEQPTNASGTMNVEKTTVTYIYKLDPACVIVYYLDESGKQIANSDTINGNYFDEYATSAKDIYGYKLIATPANANGTMTEDSIEVTYYYTLKNAGVVVNYLDENNELIAKSENITGRVYDKYNTVVKDIYGYELTATPDNAFGIMSEDEITVNYIYRLKDTSVVVKHIDAETNEPLCDAETIKGKVFDKYTTAAKSFYGYRLVSEPINASGTMTEESIEVTYYYTLKDASIIVNYIDENNNTIAPSETKTGKVGDSYTTEQKEIYGYNFVRVEGEPKGNMIDGTITVNYIYTLKPASVVVNYVDTNGEEVATTETINGKFFDSYDTSSKEIKGYTLTEQPANASGTMDTDVTEVIYIYELDPACVIVNYLDENGKAIEESESINGNYFDKYETAAKEIYGYELIAMPENATGTMTEDTIEVIYYYTLKDAKVIVNYIDTQGNKLLDSDILSGKVGDEYKTTSKNIAGYEYYSVEGNVTGEMTEDDIIINYIYNKVIIPVDEEQSVLSVIEETTELSPQTGDNNRVMMYVTIGIIAVIFIIAMIIIKKKAFKK